MLRVRLTLLLGRLNFGRLRGAIGEPSRPALLPPLPITLAMKQGFAGGEEVMRPENPTFFSGRGGDEPNKSSSLICGAAPVLPNRLVGVPELGTMDLNETPLEVWRCCFNKEGLVKLDDLLRLDPKRLVCLYGTKKMNSVEHTRPRQIFAREGHS